MGLPQSRPVQSNYDGGGAVPDFPRQPYDQSPANMAPDNGQEDNSGREDIDYILGLGDLPDF